MASIELTKRGAPPGSAARRRAPGSWYPVGWSSLPEAELRVVRLVVLGRTNREIARQLFLSWHTVNAHLRHVLLKLGLHSRVDLTRVALQHDPGIAG